MLFTDNPERDYDEYMKEQDEKTATTCDECGDVLGDYAYRVDGDLLCRGCFSEKYGQCDEPRACGCCGKFDDYYFIVGDEIYCEECADDAFKEAFYG